jgi:hypothetical protein
MKMFFAAAAIAAALTGGAQADSRLWILIDYEPPTNALGENFYLDVKAYPSRQFCESEIDHAKYIRGKYRGTTWTCAEVPASSKWALIGFDPKSAAWLEQTYSDRKLCNKGLQKAYLDPIHHPSAANEHKDWRCQEIPEPSKCDPDDSDCVFREELHQYDRKENAK